MLVRLGNLVFISIEFIIIIIVFLVLLKVSFFFIKEILRYVSDKFKILVISSKIGEVWIFIFEIVVWVFFLWIIVILVKNVKRFVI